MRALNAIKLSVAVLLAVVVAVTAMSVKEEFVELRALLKGRAEPMQNFQLIRSKLHHLSGSYVVGSLVDLVSDPSCQIKYNLAPIIDHLKTNNNDVFNNLFAYAAQIYLDRCKHKYQLELAKALSNIGQEQKSNMLQLLSDTIIQEVRLRNPSLADNIIGENEPGAMIKESIPFLAKSFQSIFEANSKSTLEKRILRASKAMGRRLSRFCPLFYEKAGPLVEKIRQITVLAGRGRKNFIASSHTAQSYTGSGYYAQGYTARSYADPSYSDNLFRFRYCEDVVRCSKAPRIIKRIKSMLTEYSLDDSTWFTDGPDS